MRDLGSEINEQDIIEGVTEGLKVINKGLEKLHEDVGESLIRQEEREEDILEKYLTDEKPIIHYY